MKINTISSFGIIRRPNTQPLWDDFKKENPEYNDLDSESLKKNMDNLFEFFADSLVENTHGIVLNEIGYFANAVYQVKKINTDQVRKPPEFNYKTDGYVYTTTFFPKVFKSNPFNGWMFKITRPKARKMTRMIVDKGVRYECHSKFLHAVNRKALKYFLKDE